MNYLVIGESVSAISMAFALASQGITVTVLRANGSTGFLRDAAVVSDTPLWQHRMSGADYIDLAIDELNKSGVAVMDDEIICIEDIEVEAGDRLIARSFCGVEFDVNKAFFAPQGVPGVLPIDFPLEKYSGDRGVTYSVTADPRMINEREVVVLGSNLYALEQGVLASKNSKNVNILLTDQLKSAQSIVRRFTENEISVPSDIHIHWGCELLSPIISSRQFVEGVEYMQGEERRTIYSDILFPAYGPVVPWDFFRRNANVSEAQEARMLCSVGLASGIEYGNHKAMWQDGLRAARNVILSAK